VVKSEAFYPDDDLAGLRQRFGNLGVDQLVKSSEPVEDDRAHRLAVRLLAYDGGPSNLCTNFLLRLWVNVFRHG
jgi:hypothetical protein